MIHENNMENLDQILEEWKGVLEEPITKSFSISNLKNKTIMETFINYENKVKASKRASIIVLIVLAFVIITALFIFGLLTYFRGPENVTYNLAEMILGTFMSLIGIAVMMRNVFKIRFPNINSNTSLEYLTTLKQNLNKWKTREKPAILFFVLFIPTGAALLTKSVFNIPFYYLFVPLFLIYISAVLYSYIKNNPEFKAVLLELDELLNELNSSK